MKRIATALLGLGLLVATPALLQARPGGGHGARLLDGLKEEAGLTDDQVAKVKTLFAANREARQKAHADLKAATASLEGLTAANSKDEGAYQAALDRMAAAHQALQSLRAQEVTQLKGILSPSQQARVVLRLTHAMKRHMERGGGSDAAE